MLREQFVAERGNWRKAGGLCCGKEIAVPGFGRRTQRLAAAGNQKAAATRHKPHEVAHSDVVKQTTAIAELKHIADEPRGRLVAAIVVSGRHCQSVRRNHDVADFEQRAATFAADLGQLGPAFRRSGEWCGARSDIARRDQRNEHAVDLAGVHRIGLARQHIAADQSGEIECDLRVGGTASGIVPQPHIPAAGQPGGIAALDRQRRAVDCIERNDPGRTPAKA